MKSRPMNLRELRWIGFAAFAAAITGWILPTFSTAEEEPSSLQRRDDRPSSTNPGLDYLRFAGGKAGQERHDNGLTIKLVWCPPGSYAVEHVKVTQENVELSVALEKPDNDDVPVDETTGKTVIGDVVTVIPGKVIVTRGYWLGKYEVTRAEWQRIMRTEPWANRRTVVVGDDYPATYVSWNESAEFCRQLTDQERNAGRLPVGWEYTLPTEAQWERACRASSETEFSFGDDESTLDEYAWFRANTQHCNEPHPHRVGLKKPNPWGLHDMHGNVVEWCRDSWWGDRPEGRDPEITERNPFGPLEKVQRGGDWSLTASCCSSTARRMAPPDLRKLSFGFRVALSSKR